MILKTYDEVYAPKLAHRARTFRLMLQHLIACSNFTPVIIETGTARQNGNWAGDGQSTLLWDFFLKHNPGTCVSIDLSPEAVAAAESQTEKVIYQTGDSIAMLARNISILRHCNLLYLDSFDLDRNNIWPSALHHLMELTAVWGCLPSGCLIVVDDCFSIEVGKHVLVQNFMTKLGIMPIFTGYQVGWVKP